MGQRRLRGPQTTSCRTSDQPELWAPTAGDTDWVGKALSATVRTNHLETLGSILSRNDLKVVDAAANLLGTFGMPLEEFGQLNRIVTGHDIAWSVAAEHRLEVSSGIALFVETNDSQINGLRGHPNPHGQLHQLWRTFSSIFRRV
jgi:hypothetical protein